ncbi:MAG: NAD(P)H-hydrate epimerase, partial [Victivallaceae bacterium]
MNKCVSIREMRQLEALTADSGICEFDLLCSAGIGAGRLIAEYLRKLPKTQAKRVVILAGGGKNGGDGFVVADYLQENTDFPVYIYLRLPPGELKGIAENYFSQIEDEIHWQQINELAEEDFLPGDVIVDALCGIGCTAPLGGQVAQWVKTINQLNYPIISLDVPSGLNAETGQSE